METNRTRPNAVERAAPTDCRGLLAVAWRSVVFLPAMLGAFALLLVTVSGLFLLPFVGGACFWFGLWGYGLASFGAWLVLLWSWRRFRLHEHFR